MLRVNQFIGFGSRQSGFTGLTVQFDSGVAGRGANFNRNRCRAAVEISAGKVMVLYSSRNVGGDVYAGVIDFNTQTVGTFVNIAATSYDGFCITPCGTDAVTIHYQNGSDNISMLAATVSGTTITTGSTITLTESNRTTNGVRTDGVRHDIQPYDSSTVLYTKFNTGTGPFKSSLISRSGTTLTENATTSATLGTSAATTIGGSGRIGILSLNAGTSVDGKVATITGTTVNAFGSTASISTTAQQNDNRWHRCLGNLSANVGVIPMYNAGTLSLMAVDISGSTPSYTTPAAITGTADSPDPGSYAFAYQSSLGRGFVMRQSTAIVPFTWSGSAFTFDTAFSPFTRFGGSAGDGGTICAVTIGGVPQFAAFVGSGSAPYVGTAYTFLTAA